MNDIKKLVRQNILNLKPYSSARDEYTGSDGIFLDANENPFGTLNRYPDPYQKALKNKLSKLKNISSENIFIGNGSDEVIDILLRIFCEPAKDKILICPPTYGMYEVSGNINDIKIVSIPLTSDFQLDLDKIYTAIRDLNTKIIFICSPNNPTGNSINDIDQLLTNFNGIVAVDEAYIDFSQNPSYLSKLNKCPNLVVMQTFSKAWGLAAARVGIAYASNEIISLMSKVKPPYNVSKLNQEAALNALDKKEDYDKEIEKIKSQRINLINRLSEINCIKKIYPSDANFLLVEVSDADAIYNHLTNKKIITRNRNSVIKNCLRITVGTEEENLKLLEELKNY